MIKKNENLIDSKLIKRISPFIFGFLIALLFLLHALYQSNPLTAFPSLDNGYYLYTGQQISLGKTPYLDFWESKPPGIFYINAFGLFLGKSTRWGVWVIEFVFLGAATILGFVTMRRIWGDLPAWLGTFTWLAGLNITLDGGNLTEEYSLLFAFLAIWAFFNTIQLPAARRYPFLLGLSFAGGFLLRANNVGVATAGVFVWVVQSLSEHDFHTLRHRLIWSGLALLGILGPLWLIFSASGNLRAFLDASLFYNFSIQKESLGLLATFQNGVGKIGIPAGFGLLGLAVLFLSKKHLSSPLHIFLLIALPLEIVLSSISGRGYTHYLMLWLPPLGFLSAILFSSILEMVQLRQKWILPILFVASFLLLPDTLKDYYQITQRLVFEREKGVEIGHPVATYLRKSTEPDDTVLIWGGRLAFNFLSHRKSPSAILFYPLLSDSLISDNLAKRFYADLAMHPPQVIVDTCKINQDLLPCLDSISRTEQQKSGHLWPFLPTNISDVYKFVQQNYTLETKLGDYPIYRWREP